MHVHIDEAQNEQGSHGIDPLQAAGDARCNPFYEAQFCQAGSQAHQAAHPYQRIPRAFFGDDIIPFQRAAHQHETDADQGDHGRVQTGEGSGSPHGKRCQERNQHGGFRAAHGTHLLQFVFGQLRSFRCLGQFRGG